MHNREKDDHAIFELVKHPHAKCGKTVKVTTPQSVVRINDREELEAQLHHYSHPFIKHLVPESTFARKFYVEKVRPALRYYCLKFGVDVPKWLKDESYYQELPEDEKRDLFGTTELNIREFAKLPRSPGGEKRVLP